jgi:flavin-dependent dehydrogenase
LTHPVAVIGGGLAGAAAALRLARGGVRPVWIAAERRSAFTPGEHLSATANPLLAALGVEDLLHDARHRAAHATYSAWGSDIPLERNAILQLAGAPYVLDRATFEAALSARAVDAGALRIDGDLLDLRIREGTWRLDTGAGQIEAGFVFDATGRRARIAARFATRFRADRLSCRYALLDAPGAEGPRPVTLIEADARGWWYLSVLADGRAVVQFYGDADLPSFDSAAFEANARATRLVSASLSDGGYGPFGPVSRVAANSCWLNPAVGEGWVAIGDASAAFDPLSSHGMTTALWSAIEAADAYLARDPARMMAYSDSVAAGVQSYLQARRAVYRRESRWPESPFWARRQGRSATDGGQSVPGAIAGHIG